MIGTATKAMALLQGAQGGHAECSPGVDILVSVGKRPVDEKQADIGGSQRSVDTGLVAVSGGCYDELRNRQQPKPPPEP